MNLNWAKSGADKLNWGRFFGRIQTEQSPVELNRRRVYILPTRVGLIFALILFAMLLGAINYNNSLAFALTFLLASLAIVSILHTFRNLHGLRFSEGIVRAVYAGEEATFPLLIDNPGSQRFAINMAFPGQAPVTVDLPARSSQWVNLHHKARKRGRLTMPRVTAYTRYPLGLFNAWGYVHLQCQGIVYPKPAPRKRLPHSVFESAGGGGDKGRGSDDFASLRPYHAGDSLRHVHWKAVAKEQGMLTKQFGGDRTEELWLHWDYTAGHDLETRLSMLCRWVLEAEEQGFAYGLIVPDTRIPPERGETHRRHCLEALALFGTTPT